MLFTEVYSDTISVGGINLKILLSRIVKLIYTIEIEIEIEIW